MKISTDTYASGAAPAGNPLPAEQLSEVQAIDGTCWAHVVVPAGKTFTAKILRAEDAEPEDTEVRVNTSWSGPVATAASSAGLSARMGWPRLVLTLVTLPPEPEPPPEIPTP